MISLLKTISEYSEDIFQQWKGARRDLDENSVHDLRVASRRATSSIVLLESVLGEDRPLKARRRIKRLLEKLGALRDLQVEISIVKKWTRTDVVDAFLASLLRSEKEEGRLIRKYLSAERKQKIRRSLKSLERKTEQQLNQLPAEMVRQKVEEFLNRQRMKFKAARVGVLPNDPQTLHALRVAAKKLRYSLDAARSIIGAAPKTEIQRLRQFQTRLGQMRDMQILKDNFQRWQLQNTATESSFPPEMTDKFTASLRI